MRGTNGGSITACGQVQVCQREPESSRNSKLVLISILQSAYILTAAARNLIDTHSCLLQQHLSQCSQVLGMEKTKSGFCVSYERASGTMSSNTMLPQCWRGILFPGGAISFSILVVSQQRFKLHGGRQLSSCCDRFKFVISYHLTTFSR